MKQFRWQVVGCSMPAVQRQKRHGHQELNRCTDVTRSVMMVGERRWRWPSTSAVRWTLSARYGGTDPLRHRNARMQRWNWIRSRTYNQWRSRRSGVTRSECLAENTQRVGRQRWGWTAACLVDDRRHRPARNSSNRPCWQPKHGLVSAGRVVKENAEHSESDVMLQSTTWWWRWHVFAYWRWSQMYPAVVNRGYRQHMISNADTYWHSWDLMLSSTRSTPKHFSLWWVHLQSDRCYSHSSIPWQQSYRSPHCYFWCRSTVFHALPDRLLFLSCHTSWC